jgi:hypothetical protein
MSDKFIDKLGQAGAGSIDVAKPSPSADKNNMQSSSCCKEQVKEHMDVIASCGTKVGVVDRVEGGSIKLAKKDSPDGQHHMIPNAWIDHVDTNVHLNRNNQEVKRHWQSAQ